MSLGGPSALVLARWRSRTSGAAVLSLTCLLAALPVTVLLLAVPLLLDAGVEERAGGLDAGERTVLVTARLDDPAEVAPAQQAVAAAVAAAFGRPAVADLQLGVRSRPLDILAVLDARGGAAAGGAAGDGAAGDGPVGDGPTGDAVAGDGSAPGLVLLADDPARQAADLVEGVWPGAPGEVALHAGAADRLEVATGSTLRVDTARVGLDDAPVPLELVVTGTWLPTDARDAAWAAEPLAGTGGSDRELGPALVAPGAAGEVAALQAAEARWRLLPPLDGVAGVERAAAAAGTLAATVEADPALSRGSASSPDEAYAALLAGAERDGVLLRAGAVLVGLLALTALALAARGVQQGREGEAFLLRSRGASSAGGLAAGLFEAVTVTLPAVAGAVAAAAVLRGAAAGSPAGAGPWGFVAVAIAVGLVAALVAGILAWPFLRAGGRRPAVRPRARRALQLAAEGVLVVVAAVALLQLRSGQLAADDPVAVVGPGIVVLAGAVAGRHLVTVATRPLGPVAARDRGLTGALASWELTRRPARTGSTATVSALGVATCTLLLVLGQGVLDQPRELAERQLGVEARVSLDRPPDDTQSLVAGPALGEAADRVVPVATGEARLGGEPVTLLAADPDRLAEVARWPRSVAPEPSVAGALAAVSADRPELPGVDVPDGTAALTLVASVERDTEFSLDPAAADELAELLPDGFPSGAELSGGASAPVLVELVVLGPGGIVETVPLGRLEASDSGSGQDAPDRQALTVELPAPLAGGHRVVGVELRLTDLRSTLPADSTVDVAVERVTAAVATTGDREVTADRELTVGEGQWQSWWRDEEVGLLEVGTGAGGWPAVTFGQSQGSEGFSSGAGAVRLGLGEPPEPRVLPVLAAGVPVVGEDMEVGGQRIPVTAVASAPLLPGVAGPAVLADLATLSTAALVEGRELPAVRSWWVAGLEDDPVADGTVTRLARLADPSGSATVSVLEREVGEAVAGTRQLRAALLAAAAAASVLAVVAAAAIVGAGRRARRDEDRVLAALGSRTGALRATAMATAATAAGLGALVGVAVGLLAGWAALTPLLGGLAAGDGDWPLPAGPTLAAAGPAVAAVAAVVVLAHTLAAARRGPA